MEEYSESFPEKDDLVFKLEKISKKYIALKLPQNSYWYNKANFFSLIIVMYNEFDKLTMNGDEKEIAKKLKKFERNLPEDYSLAAKEAVNNKKERSLRNKYLEEILLT